MTDLPPRKRVQPAPTEPPVGELGSQRRPAVSGPDETITVPHDIRWGGVKTLKMTEEHAALLNELKLRHGVKIQEAVWYAIEHTYGNK